MEILPLPKKLFDRARELFITKIDLSFQGGSDEGYLEVDWELADDIPDHVDCRELLNKQDQFMGEIQEWADEVYEYSGSGDGTAYGDDITYDLVEMKAYHTGWYHAVTESDETEVELSINDDEE